MSSRRPSNAASSASRRSPSRCRSIAIWANAPPQRLLVFCDEAADAANPLQALQGDATAPNGIDILIGPEGGFAEEERDVLLRQPRILRLSLGPRVLRADTAAVAALALVQAALGDWTAATCPDRL